MILKHIHMIRKFYDSVRFSRILITFCTFLFEHVLFFACKNRFQSDHTGLIYSRTCTEIRCSYRCNWDWKWTFPKSSKLMTDKHHEKLLSDNVFLIKNHRERKIYTQLNRARFFYFKLLHNQRDKTLKSVWIDFLCPLLQSLTEKTFDDSKVVK